MRPPAILIQSIKIYFITFLVTGTLLLLLLIGSLYKEISEIQNTMHSKAQLLADQEIETILEETIINLTSNILELADWDEVRQQISDRSFYFYWQDDRLKGSEYFKKNYAQVEIYDKNKWLLISVLSQRESPLELPLNIEDLSTQIIFTQNDTAVLHMFEPIVERDSDKILGYVGISVNLLPYLLTEYSFKYTDELSLHLTGIGSAPLSELSQHIAYKPITNPVSDALWQLINDFILTALILLFIGILVVAISFKAVFSHPLEVLSLYVQQLKKSPKKAYPEPSETFFLTEFEELKHSIHDYHGDLLTTQKALNDQYHLVWDQARRDVLTNISNRRAFDEAWNEVLESYEKKPIQTAFMLFDCDFFKALNDTYGHEVGDDVIRVSAVTIQKALPMEHPVFRIGGDEFAVIIQNKSMQETIDIASKCLQALQAHSFSGIGIKEKLSFSVGISHTNPRSEDQISNAIENLPRQADIAMYKAKQSHQYKIKTYQAEFDSETHSLVSNELVNTIVEAIHTGNNIQMHYQPIQAISDNQLYYESLIRIKKIDTLIYPYDIFSVVERRRLEVEIDTQIIQQILIAIGKGVIPKNTGVSINVSGKTLLQNNFVSLFEPFIPYLKEYKIVIEIVENTLIDHLEYAKSVLNILREQGFLIALDDFGSGYSSIRYLAHMPIDIIKFDMSMTLALRADEKTKNIIQSTAEMVRRSGYDLVLEGVEDEDMLEKAKQAGATHIQGYLLGKPHVIPEIKNPM
ncbi:MAG: hypothetical protein ISEC1_P0664 [Thiomicrorhabdus sp.]|nr:MAG: hypothetical protein ISEC1_P0664 [Thiomicrorhabdus sp.]